jgi:hypothetical protein
MTEEKRPLGRTRHRWEDIKMALKERVLERVDWIHLGQNREQCLAVVSMVMNLLVP